MLRTTILLLLTFFATISSAQVSLASWNIKRLGANEHAKLELIANVASRFDFVAIQEGQSEEALEQLRAAVQSLTRERWGVLASHRIGRGSYKEIYAFLWRERAIEYVDGAVVYLDRGDVFSREPFSARFRMRATGESFAAANVHLIYGDDPNRRHREAMALAAYWTWLGATYAGTEPVMFGDFNLEPDHGAWGALKDQARPLIMSGKTTVSARAGRFVSLYDNIWVGNKTSLKIGKGMIFNAPHVLGLEHGRFINEVSDHTPVYVMLGVERTAAAPLGSARTHAVAIVANKNSGIYHLPACPGFDAVGERNKVAFNSEDEARAAGYRKARNCQ